MQDAGHPARYGPPTHVLELSYLEYSGVSPQPCTVQAVSLASDLRGEATLTKHLLFKRTALDYARTRLLEWGRRE